MDNKLYYNLHFGDNLEYLKKTQNGSVDLMYLDPPFNSKADYNIIVGGTQVEAFGDTWTWGTEDMWAKATLLEYGGKVAGWANGIECMIGQCGMTSYLYYMALRLVECSRVLSPTGSIWLHCDDNASHYLRGLMDAVFDQKCYKNTVTWKRTNAHSDPGRFGRVADRIFYYARLGAVWNEIRQPYSQDYIDQWFTGEDEQGKYRPVLLTGAGVSQGSSGEAWRGYDPAKSGKGRHWSVPKRVCKILGIDEDLTSVIKLEKMDTAGYILWPKKEGGAPRFKQYLHEMDGKVVQDIWDDVPGLGTPEAKAESVGYATQKPLALLDRIIKCSSNPGDLVMDPFCGSGTTVLAAAKLGRHAVGCDITYHAISLAKDRLEEAGFKLTQMTGSPTTMEDADTLADMDKWQYQSWILSKLGIGSEREGFQSSAKGADKGIDGQHFNPKTGVRTIVSVKGGSASNGGASAIRDLIGTVLATGSDRGVFVCRKAPSPQMIEASTSAGLTEDGHPKVIIITQEDIINGKCPNLNREW